MDTQHFGIGNSPVLPTTLLEPPTRTIEGKIKDIRYTENPITIMLDNSTSWKVDKKQWDYLVSVGKEPKIGKRVQLEMFLDGTIKSINYI
jgi:hypothetical protein